MLFLEAEQFLIESRETPLLDVRSPAEFAQGHIPSAINMPIFNNKERAIIGTIYAKEGRQTAIHTGLEITGPKMAEFASKAVEIAVKNKLLVHCWRGGMRSESMAWLYERLGITCSVLKGGYKAYRNYLSQQLSHIPKLIVIEGPTGCGKTEILHHLKKSGEQVIDLEDLAKHKGSVFGGIGQEIQPTTQQFQNNLLKELLSLDRNKRIFIEGESQTIGKVFLPDQFWNKMNEAEVIEINVSREARIKRLTCEYGKLPKEDMELAIESLSKRLGEVRKKEILLNYQQGKMAETASKLLDYYDKAYQFSTLKYKHKGLKIEFVTGNAGKNTNILLKRIKEK